MKTSCFYELPTVLRLTRAGSKIRFLSGCVVAFPQDFLNQLGNAGASPNYFLSSSDGRSA